MKRAWLIFIAVLAVVLVYPATTPSAKSPSDVDSPHKHIITSMDGKYLPDDPEGSGDGDGDSGDADDVGGWKGGGDTPWQRSGFGPGSTAKVWWMYFLFVYRIY